jgi:DNA polymerase-3 subunit alpha
MSTLIKRNMLPEDTAERLTARRIYEFNRYLKAICKHSGSYYKLDTRAVDFLTEMEYDNLIEQEGVDFVMGIKAWDKVYDKWMGVFRTWMSENKEDILDKLNKAIFLEQWEKYAKGTISAWEMEALCFYYHDHELKHLNYGKYGISNFYELPEEPVIEKTFEIRGKTVNIFKLTKICGTCIAKNKDKGQVVLLTPEGVVTVKFRKEYFAMFDKQISEKQADGTKKVMERSWFNRGSMIMVQGMRSGDMFIPKKYASSGASHQLYKITGIDEEGDITLQTDRYQGGILEDDGQ